MADFQQRLAGPLDRSKLPAWAQPLVTVRSALLFAVATVLLLVAAAGCLRSQLEQARLLTAQLAAVQATPAQEPLDGAAAASPALPLDFTHRLPDYPDVAAWVAELQRAGTAAGVGVQEMQAHTTLPTEQQLAQTELSVQLRGAYPAIKTVLREVQARYPHVTVRRLALRRNAAPQDLQADVAWVLWAKPLRPAGASSGASPAAGGTEPLTP